MQLLLKESDGLLDLHSTTKESTPLAICEPHSFDIARKLSVQIISSGWDAIHPGSSDGYMNKTGKIGICVECGQHSDERTPRRARSSIGIFLREMGLTDTSNFPHDMSTKRHIQVRERYVARKTFSLSEDVAENLPDFGRLEVGTLIGHDGRKPVHLAKSSIVLFLKKIALPGEESFILADEISF